MKIVGFTALVALQALFMAQTSSAQVVFTVGADEYYDDNIFLENDNGVPAPIIVDGQLGQPGGNQKVPDEFNGDPDSDFITNAYVSGSGALNLSPKIRSSASARVGAIFMADYTDQNRLTLDSNLSFSPEKGVLPDPLTLGLTDTISSRGNNVASADGTASRQTQTHQVGMTLGLNNMQLAEKTSANLVYGFVYSQYLGAFMFNNQKDSDLGAYANRTSQDRDDGSDYITNGVDGSINQNVAQDLVAGVFAGVTNYTYTRVGGLADNRDESDFDRLDFRTGVRGTYQASEIFIIHGSVGMLRTSLANDPDPITGSIVNADGSVTPISTTPDKETTNLIYSGGFTYYPVPSVTTIFSMDQFSGPDTSGNRITTRSFSLDTIKTIGDRTRLGATGRYLQFNSGDELNNATDRYEVSTFVAYNIFQNVAIQGGWNFGIQRVDDNNVEQQVLQGNNDYEFNRFFIGLSTGFVGAPS